jgi:hypothetical protein
MPCEKNNHRHFIFYPAVYFQSGDQCDTGAAAGGDEGRIYGRTEKS